MRISPSEKALRNGNGQIVAYYDESKRGLESRKELLTGLQMPTVAVTGEMLSKPFRTSTTGIVRNRRDRQSLAKDAERLRREMRFSNHSQLVKRPDVIEQHLNGRKAVSGIAETVSGSVSQYKQIEQFGRTGRMERASVYRCSRCKAVASRRFNRMLVKQLNAFEVSQLKRETVEHPLKASQNLCSNALAIDVLDDQLQVTGQKWVRCNGEYYLSSRKAE